MAIILKKCTSSVKGEQQLARRIDLIADNSITLCFNIDFLPAVREIDLFLLSDKLGGFIIEVKAIGFDAIQGISPSEWVISGRGVTQNPLLQAYDQFDGLRNYWKAHKKSKLPRICVTACFPEISRAEWLSRFPNDSYPWMLAFGLIFKEDLIDLTAFYDRLAYVMAYPPIRLGFLPSPPRKDFLLDLRDIFAVVRPNELSQNDRQRLVAIERGVNAAVKADFPTGQFTCAIFSGYPGTGKTFRLLSIALSHVFEGSSVLFVCFNKTLASEVRRLLQFSEKLKHASGRLEIRDVFHLTLRDQEINGLKLGSFPNPDVWGETVVASFKEKQSEGSLRVDIYDTVLVDESHDMMDWHFEVINFHTRETTSVCVAAGRGQDLYRSESTVANWVKSRARGNPIQQKQLRRNFRNTPMQYFAALAFHKAWPLKLNEVFKAYSIVASNKGRNDEFDFDRQGGPLQYISIPTLKGEFDNEAQDQDILVSQEYVKIIKKEIRLIQADKCAKLVGLLILVPAEKSQQTRWARLALDNICQLDCSISYIDYTVDEARRGSASSDQIRLCTFHSSRGLEGDRALIFGLEYIEKVALQANAKAENLGFIALSRGVHDTTVIVRNHFLNNVHSLLKEIETIGNINKL